MATAGEAASLFGATDSANDPFALPPPEAPQPSDNDPFANVQPTAEAADLFGYAASHGTAQVPQQGVVSTYETTETQDANWNGSSGNQYTPGTSQVQQSYGYTPQASYVAQPATNGYNDARNQWSDYTTQQQQYGTANGTYTNGTYTQSTQINDPYAPHASQSYAPSKVPHASAQNSTYEPYAPSTNGYNAYTPPAASHASVYDSSYDPYKPSQTASAPPHAGQPSSTYVQFLNGPVDPVPQPEAPVRSAAAAEQYRPKTFDAYDPPLPPVKPAHKRPAAWQSPITSPVQPAYPSLPNSPAFRSAQSPALPPPPRKASVPPPPRTGSASRQYSSSPVPPAFPHTQVSYGAQHYSPSSTISPPPRSDSAARHYATPPLPHSHPPFTSPSYEQPPPPQHSTHTTFSPPFTYQTPPPPSVYQTLPPHSAHQQHPPLASIHEPPPPQTTTSSGFVAPAPSEHYIPTGTPEYAQSQPGSQSAVNAVEPHVTEPYWDHAQKQDLEQESASVTHQPSEDPNDPEVNAVLSTIEEHHTVAAESMAAEDHEQPSIATEAEVGMHTESEHGTLHVEETVVNETVPIQEVNQPVSQLPPVAQTPAVQPTHDPYRPALAIAHADPVYENPVNTVSSFQAPPASSWSPPRQSVEASRPTGVSSPPVPTPPTRSSTDSHRPSPYSYEPAATPIAVQRTTSPSSISTHSGKSTYSIHDAYAPPVPAATGSNARYRSASNGSMLSLNSVHSVQDDPYAPARHSRQQSTESSSFTTARTFADDSSLVTPTASSQAQVVTLAAPMRSQYAPSPSLLGSNDPLGRTSVRVPVFTFGFGGQVVTCFHGSEMLQTGFDVAMSSRASTSLRIRPLSSIIPQSAIETSAATFPGPLFSDPGTPTTTLVRPGAATHAKAKKAKVVKYLEERAEEITQGLGYLHQGSVELYRAEAKCALISLLKVMVENDGRLSGTPQIDASVRAALIPSAEPVLDSSEPATSGARTAFDLTSSSYGSLSALAYDTKNTKLVDHPLWSSQLDKIEALLVRGDRRGAYHYAADEKLWAHAMVIASSIDKEAWKEVVTEFVHSELSGGHAAVGASAVPNKPSSVDRREPLRVAYSLFAGQGSAAVQELHPPKPLGVANHSLSALPAATAASTPLSAGFAQPVQAVELPKEVLMKWSTTVAMMIGSPLTMDSSSALTVLGDHLAFNGWHEAAHVCYLLSPQTSLVGGVRLPGVRVVLYGSPNPYTTPTVCKDPDAVIFSEVVEYALSLTPPAKGQEPFAGLPHLQPYRLLRASYLAELGHVALAKRYCDAISTSTNRASPYLNATFKEQLDDLGNRLEAAPLMDKSGSWIGSKMAKPSLDKIGGWLEGRFTSFIAGEGDSPNPAVGSNKVPTFSGPFTQYGEISSTNNSNIPSPQMSSTNLAQMQAQAQPAAPPFRTGSAMALRASTTSPAQIARASSAIDYLRRKPSPVHRASSASVSPAIGLSARTQSTYGYPNGFASSSNPDMSTPTVQEEAPVTSNGPRVASWWGGGESESATPTATTFAQPDEHLQHSSSDGFISLIDTPGFSGPSSTTTAQFTAAARAQSIGQDELDEEDDLGLGNTSSRKKEVSESSTEPEKKAAAPAAAPEKHQESEKHAASGGGWLSRLWKRSDSSGPIKANLGDENTFYYDAEQKRWVNKNAPPEPAKPPPPQTPPVRPQTASPGMTGARGAPPPSSPLPPPVRPATAIDLTDGPPKKPPMRIRSNLAPPADGLSGPNTPGSAPLPSIPRTPNTMMDGPPGMDGPPTPGVRKAGVKRNARSRYVDVFQ